MESYRYLLRATQRTVISLLLVPLFATAGCQSGFKEVDIPRVLVRPQWFLLEMKPDGEVVRFEPSGWQLENNLIPRTMHRIEGGWATGWTVLGPEQTICGKRVHFSVETMFDMYPEKEWELECRIEVQGQEYNIKEHLVPSMECREITRIWRLGDAKMPPDCSYPTVRRYLVAHLAVVPFEVPDEFLVVPNGN